MTLGIVGVERKKLTPARFVGAVLAIEKAIRNEGILEPRNHAISSGACHLGGIDLIAEHVADWYGMEKKIFAPKDLNWTTGYMPRNLEIAKASDVVYCITVKTLPDGYDGMRFPLCYHCGTDEHIKSGGCWTVKQALRMGKRGHVIVLD